MVAAIFVEAALSAVSYSSMKDTVMVQRQRAVQWELCLLNKSGAEGVTKVGSPQAVDCPYGKAVQFDGNGDALFLGANPLQHLHRFTVEVIFRPDPRGLPEQRFLHMGEASGDRMLIETRLTDDDEWYLDAFIKSGDSSHTLIDKSRTHPTGKWYHIAFVVDDGKMDTFVNGVHELEGRVHFTPFKDGTTSIGVRMNKVCWFKGAIYKIRVTPSCLAPSGFMKQ